MKFKVWSIKDVGSCNYCDKSKLSTGGFGLVYPYDKVIELRGETITVRMCKDCFKELVNDSDTYLEKF